VLCQGQAKLATTGNEGRTLILRIAKPGEVLGLSATVTGGPYELTCETMQPCQLNFVEREDLLCFLREHGDACLHVAQHLSHHCQEIYDLIRHIGLSHLASERLARFLLESAVGRQVSHGVVRVKLALTRTEISQLVGLNRVTVSRTLREFRTKQIAELDGATLIIRNRAALERLVAS
jgi:CRP/FNR family transcriptional regulator, cyclic AMP receptor protein